jgi:hypothetical protein
MAHRVEQVKDVTGVVGAMRSEFDEMPGLRLTAEQARRLWAIEPRVCTRALAQLVDLGYLEVSASGQYVRPSAA